MGASHLPKISMKGDEDTTYYNRTSRNKTFMQKEGSKTTLNIMNVTFNSRPGVKQYINGVVGKKGVQVDQMPKQGQRQYKHNGYNNFYFSSQKRGTV